MGTAPFDPSTFFVPATDPDRLEYTAGDLKGDGADIVEGAADIHTAWAGLSSCYSAPEAELLFSAVDAVPEDAGEVDGALGTAATALTTFAERARELRRQAWALQGDARRFNARVADDEDWAKGTLLGQESEEYTEYSRINSEKIRIQNDFMAAEAECANAIVALFSARRYTAVNPDGSTRLRGGEIAYGFTEITEELENAWGEPEVGVDHYWFWDVQHAAWDFGGGILENAGGMVGMHGAGGWDFEWGTNVEAHWWGVVQGAGAAVGLYDAEIDHWGFQSWERSREIAWDTAVEAAHAIVPWQEWEERPAYVITTALLNVGTIAAGVALSSTGVGAVVGVPLLAYKGLKILDGLGGGHNGLTGAVRELIDNAASGRHGGSGGSGGGSGQATPVISVDEDTLRAFGFDPEKLRALITGLEALRDQDPRSPSGDGAADAERPADPTAAELAAGQGFLDGIDPRSRSGLEEGLREEQGLWVTGQVPDDVSSVNDTPVQRYETDPPRIEAQDGRRVEVDSAGNEITAHHDTTITNSIGSGGGSPDTPNGGTITVDPDSGPGSRPGHGRTSISTGGDGGGLPNGPGTPEQQPPEYVQRSGGIADVGNPRANMEAGDGFYDSDNHRVDLGYRDETGTYFDGEGNRYVDVPQNAWALKQYGEIRANDGDVDHISENTGLNRDVIYEVKQHLFLREHVDVPSPPDGRQRTGRFAPVEQVAELWRKAETGTLNASESAAFRNLVAHEYVKARLMEEGVPYRSRDPQLWNNDQYEGTSERNGADDISPWGDPEADGGFELWENWGIPEPESGFRTGDDLSGLDRVAESALNWWRERNPYNGAAHRPSYEHTQTIDVGDSRYPGERQRFGTGEDGEEVKLDPHTLYRVEGRGVFITDADGRIVHVETRSSSSADGNPELVYPRPNAMYYVDHPKTGGQFVYGTDDKSRTISIEGELRTGRESRNNEQTPIGHEGRNYFSEYNKRDDTEYKYDEASWQGGHLVASNMFGGPGERINIIPMLKSLNHPGQSRDFYENWGRLEYLWNGILKKDEGTLGRAYNTAYAERQPGGKPALTAPWLSLAGEDPRITFRMEVEYDDSLPEYERHEYQHRSDLTSHARNYERNRPAGMNYFGAPPARIVIDWRLNGIDQAKLRYDNHPSRTLR
ncbi:DNA/RNA non-specific endonuclease [Nocardiopsis sp. N85]|uniref:DNA/RNA non-specific endonuclease n=1 Tax=Nocardiopsis sp. N85 TaxID=3029400 RepID=UPI00237FAEF4|nr:DNA/RNA non-specific endonuclease [Nocardiopsis sp. N85]MDE3719945.1 DNA/RNA non-specific endonuclease [Nocardiopsis sp. N85]